MTTKELFDKLSEKLIPIIINDEDIIRVVNKNNMSKDDESLLILWLLNATIGCLLNGSTGEVEKKLSQNCAHDMSVAEVKLHQSGYDENVHDTLVAILEENIGEWLQILKKEFAKTEEGQNDKNVVEEETQNDDPATATFKLYVSFLGNVVDREDDVTEFLDKYPNIDSTVLRMYLIINVFYVFLKDIEAGSAKPPKQSNVYKYRKQLLETATAFLQAISNDHLKHNVSDVEEFNSDVKEIINDHFNEFIKKTFKQIFKSVDEIKKKK